MNKDTPGWEWWGIVASVFFAIGICLALNHFNPESDGAKTVEWILWLLQFVPRA